MKQFGVSLLIAVCATVTMMGQEIYVVSRGSIAFTSEAPLELIQARSSELRGVFDVENRTCAFTIDVSTFKGFNSPLQQVHFNENYLESDVYPQATFAGKLIEQLDLKQQGRYEVRVKGDLSIHGVTRERIVKGVLVISDSAISIHCDFEVALQEHNIRIPKVVQQKIAESIAVKLEAELAPRGG